MIFIFSRNTTPSVSDKARYDTVNITSCSIVGLQLRTALRAQFAESCAHIKESLKNYRSENSLLDEDDYYAEGKEKMYACILHTYLSYILFYAFRWEKVAADVEKNKIKFFSRKVANINCFFISYYYVCILGKCHMEIYQVCSTCIIIMASFMLESYLGNGLTSLLHQDQNFMFSGMGLCLLQF